MPARREVGLPRRFSLLVIYFSTPCLYRASSQCEWSRGGGDISEQAYDTTKEKGVHIGMASMWQALYIKWSNFCMHNTTAQAELFFSCLFCSKVTTNGEIHPLS